MSDSMMDVTVEEIKIRIEAHRLIASDWSTISLGMVIANVVLAAIVSSSLFDVVALPQFIPAFMSLLVAINSGLIAAFDPPSRVEKHRDAISQYSQIINKDFPNRDEKASEIERVSPFLPLKTRKRSNESLEAQMKARRKYR